MSWLDSGMATFVRCERDQAFLLPPDMKDWLPEDDLAHCVIPAAERVSMSAFQVNDRNSGKPQYHPRMMLVLLVYAYANGLFSSRRIERATHRDLGVRFVTASTHPDHDTIAAFRQQNRPAFEAAFLDILLMARRTGLLRVGTVSVDGTKIDASAWMKAEARAEAEAARPAYEAKKAAYDAKTGRRGRPPKPPNDAQAVVCAHGAQLILATNLVATSADAPSFAETILSMQGTVGLPERVLADAGYASRPAVEALQAQGVEPLVAIGRTQPHRPYDFRPPPPPKTPRRITEPWRIAMQAKLETEDAKALYKKRKQTVEPVFGIIKSVIGFRRFSLRGIGKAATEWTLVALAYNCKRVVTLETA